MRSSQHPPELVERVAEQIRAAVYAAGDEAPSVTSARYALDLAARAAFEVIWAAPKSKITSSDAVQLAVEGA